MVCTKCNSDTRSVIPGDIRMKKLIILVALAAVCMIVFNLGVSPAYGTTRYIAQTAGAFSGGTACKGQNAITPATWNATAESPGDISYVCGTITAPLQTELLIFKWSGTSSSPIQLIFDSGAILSSPEWPADGSGGAIDLGSQNYITINGQGNSSGGGGIIEATSNGDSGAACLSGSCTYHSDSNAIEANGANNITIEGLSIIDMYVATNPNPGGGTCIYDYATVSNWTVTNNFMHDVAWCVEFQYTTGTSSNITISNNQIYNVDHGIAFGGYPASANLSNVYIYGNNIHDYSNWDTSSDTWHHDGVHIWGYNDNGSDTISGVYVYNNHFGGCMGQNTTAHVFMEQNAGGTKSVYVFNNTFIDTCNSVVYNGFFTRGATSGSDGPYYLYNNTFLATSSSNTDACMGSESATDVTYINNVASGCTQGLMYMANGSAASGGLHNNLYANGPGSCASSANCYQYGGSSWFGTFSNWQSTTGQDASPSAYVSSAGLNASGVPQSGSAVIGVGANLTSLCSGTLTALCSDMTGAARPSSGAWTAGAYSTTGPMPPTSVNGKVQTK